MPAAFSEFFLCKGRDGSRYIAACIENRSIPPVSEQHIQRTAITEMINETKTSDIEIFNLYKYFMWANSMKHSYENLLSQNVEDVIPKSRFEAEYNLYISYWFGGLYVVMEGWTELKLKDRRIDALLKSPNVNLLRRYRNGVFHFQRDYFDERFMGFLRDGLNRIEWVGLLHDEFERFFLEWAQGGSVFI